MSYLGPSPRKLKRLGENNAAAGSSGLDNDDEGFDKATILALHELNDVQDELFEVNKKALKDVFVVEAKYNELMKPCYDKRAALIDQVPNFWSKALLSHPHISMIVEVEEEECLHFLNQLIVEEFGIEKNKYHIRFLFDENPYFENSELVKEINWEPGKDPESTSTTIQWKEQMDLSKKHSQIIDGRRKRGLVQETFFSWFSHNEACRSPMGDYIAEAIRNEVWRNPLKFPVKLNLDEVEDEQRQEDCEDKQRQEEKEKCEEEESEEECEEKGSKEKSEEGNDKEEEGEELLVIDDDGVVVSMDGKEENEYP